jgi:MFS-type transporter involved in bile tolerance (Atg22 family)
MRSCLQPQTSPHDERLQWVINAKGGLIMLFLERWLNLKLTLLIFPMLLSIASDGPIAGFLRQGSTKQSSLRYAFIDFCCVGASQSVSRVFIHDLIPPFRRFPQKKKSLELQKQ